jgi:hypothetical protein
MLDFTRIKTFPIRERENKFHLKDMLLPGKYLAGEMDNIAPVAERIAAARKNGRKTLLQMGAAVVKEGCGPLIIDLMQRGYIHHVAGNGAVSIHDFEIALIGETSEHVPDGLRNGTFGMAEETGRMMNEAINRGGPEGRGLGWSIGRMIDEQNLPHKEYSLAWNCYRQDIPFTIHVTPGCDIIHQHPLCDGAATGAATFTDFKIFTETMSQLREGVLLNYGSAVTMPEVFLKALTIARNLGCDVEKFTTVNFDFFDMYRPRTRVVEWPKTLECEGFDVRGGHRQTFPALHRAIGMLDESSAGG